MSTYVKRFYEVRLPVIDNHLSQEKQLEDIKEPKDGYTVHVSCNAYERRYLVWNESKKEWTPKEDVPHKWVMVKWYTPSGYGYHPLEKDVEIGAIVRPPHDNPYEEEDPRNMLMAKVGDTLNEQYEYLDNGGIIRDEYISSCSWGNHMNFSDRGFPKDMSDELKKILDDDYNKYCWGGTYVTLKEWSQAYHERLEKFKKEINERYEKKYKDELNAKLDNLLLLAQGKEIKKPKKKKEEDEEEEWHEDTLDYMWEDPFYDLRMIDGEMDRANDLTEHFGYLSNEDIRIIYYMC